jgi:hypothetical protein
MRGAFRVHFCDGRLVTLSLVLPCLLAASLARQAEVIPGGGTERVDPALQSAIAALDPLAAGWESEAQADATSVQLKRIAAALERGEAAPPAGVFDAGFRFESAGPLERLRADAFVEVQRATGSPGEIGDASAFLAHLGGPFQGASEVHAKLKFVRVDNEAGLRTEAFLIVVGERPGGSVQLNGWWDCRWLEREGEPPRLVEVRVLEHEVITAQARGHFVLSECSASAFGASTAWEAQLRPGINAWRAHLDTRLGVPFVSHAAGIAIADVDGDGLEDLYLCQPGGLPNKLFLHQPDGTLRDVSAEAGVDVLDFSRSALLVDLDGDADRDLVLCAAERLLLYTNEGRARFWLQGALEAPDTTSLAAADIDLDGDLDLYACAYASPYDHSSLPVPYHDANNGKPNLLFENRGDWLFVEATEERGLDQNNRRFSFAASFEDYDGDGDPDLYVANDFGRNNLYRNDGGRFTDVAPAAGVEDISAGMGATWGDFDGDLSFDLYVSNMYSSAGNRIAFQRRFQDGASDAVRGLYQRHAHGNTLFRNDGHGKFSDVTGASPLGVSMGRWAWGALFADLDNDGWQDLLSPNGFFTGEKTDDL